MEGERFQDDFVGSYGKTKWMANCIFRISSSFSWITPKNKNKRILFIRRNIEVLHYKNIILSTTKIKQYIGSNKQKYLRERYMKSREVIVVPYNQAYVSIFTIFNTIDGGY